MKKTGRFLFETELEWTEDNKGILRSRAISSEIKVATPKIFKGLQGGMWSPEHLLISAASSCFMTTYLFYAKQKGLPVSGFECEAIGQVERINNKLNFTSINLYPKVGIEKTEWTELAKAVIELTKQNCLISRALNMIIYYHPTIEIKVHPPEKKKQPVNKNREVFF